MILQVQPTSVKLMQILSQLGRGIGNTVRSFRGQPTIEETRQNRQQLIQNPDRLLRFAEAQREAEDRAAQQIADAQTEQGAVPNIGEPLGFDMEETQELVGLAARLPEEELAAEQAESGIEAEKTFQQEGGPEAEGRRRVATAESETAQARLQEKIAQGIDAQTAVDAINIEREANIELNRTQTKSLGRLKEFRESARRRGDMQMVRIIDSVLAGQEGIAQAILEREKLGLEERIAQWEQAAEGMERKQEEMKLLLDVDERIDEKMTRIRELMTEQPEGWEETFESEVARLNDVIGKATRVLPEGETTHIATIMKEGFGSIGIQMQEIPVITNRPELQREVTEILTTAATDPDASVDQLFQSKRFRSIMQAIPADQTTTNSQGEVVSMRSHIRNAAREAIQQRKKKAAASKAQEGEPTTGRLQFDEKTGFGTTVAQRFKDAMRRLVDTWIDASQAGTRREGFPTGAIQ